MIDRVQEYFRIFVIEFRSHQDILRFHFCETSQGVK